MKMRQSKGFTLIELLIVVAIILIIAFVHSVDQHVLAPLQASVSRHYAG